MCVCVCVLKVKMAGGRQEFPQDIIRNEGSIYSVGMEKRPKSLDIMGKSCVAERKINRTQVDGDRTTGMGQGATSCHLASLGQAFTFTPMRRLPGSLVPPSGKAWVQGILGSSTSSVSHTDIPENIPFSHKASDCSETCPSSLNNQEHVL